MNGNANSLVALLTAVRKYERGDYHFACEEASHINVPFIHIHKQQKAVIIQLQTLCIVVYYWIIVYDCVFHCIMYYCVLLSTHK